MTTNWPLGTPTVEGPYTSANAFTNVLIKSAPIDQKYIAMISGNPGTGTIFTSPRNSAGGFQKFNVITSLLDTATIDFATAPIPTSAAMQGLISLQTSTFAKSALLGTDFAALNVDWFNQFAIPSTILTSMLAYGNRDNVTSINDVFDNVTNTRVDSDTIGVWTHQGNCPMLILTDAVTFTVKGYRTATSLTPFLATIAEWRWLHPNRSRCTNPTSPYLNAILQPNAKVTNTRTYPQGATKWDMMRYDFFETGINGSLEANNILILDNPTFPMTNLVFDIRYDYVAAPGSIVFLLKARLMYDDGSGSVDKFGNNTSRVIMDPTVTRAFPIVFRVGMEWLEDFLEIIQLGQVLDNDGIPLLTPPLQMGADLRPSLRFLYRAYLNAKRLYIWRVWNDIARFRVNYTNSNAITPITGGNLDGIYMCLLDGITDYSGVVVNAPSIPFPQWENMYIQKYRNGVKDTLVVLTSVEISAYISASFVSEDVPADKYGLIRILVDTSNKPLRSLPLSSINFAIPDQGTIHAENCFVDTVCWTRFNPPPAVVIPPVTKGTTPGNITIYVIAAIILVVIIVVAIFFVLRGRRVVRRAIEIDPPKSVVPPSDTSVLYLQKPPVVSTSLTSSQSRPVSSQSRPLPSRPIITSGQIYPYA